MTRKYVSHPYTPIGLAIAQHIRSIGITHAEFSRRVSMHGGEVSKIMHGQSNLTARSANLLITQAGEFLRPACVETMLEQHPSHPLCREILKLRGG